MSVFILGVNIKYGLSFWAVKWPIPVKGLCSDVLASLDPLLPLHRVEDQLAVQPGTKHHLHRLTLVVPET